MPENKAPAIKRKWEYATWKDKALSTTVTAVALGCYGWCLAQVFNPIALGLAGTWTAYRLAKDVLRPAFSETQRQKDIAKNIEKGDLIPPENYRNIETIVRELSTEMGLSYTPPIYFLGEEKAAQFVVNDWKPWDRLFDYEALSPEARREKNKRLAENFDNFMADSAYNAIYTTPGSVDKTGDEELRWVLGHEIAHLKNRDGIRISKIGRYGVEKMSEALFFTAMPFEPYLALFYAYTLSLKQIARRLHKAFDKDQCKNKAKNAPPSSKQTPAAKEKQEPVPLPQEKTSTADGIIAGSVVFALLVAAPVAIGAWIHGYIVQALPYSASTMFAGTALALTSLPMAAKGLLNVVSRHIEKRADRNSLYHTRNPAIEPSFMPLKPPVFSALSLRERFNYHAHWKLSTHPGPIERRAALMEAWEKMDEFEDPPLKKPAPPPPTIMNKIAQTLRL